jgi:hypothetical protein
MASVDAFVPGAWMMAVSRDQLMPLLKPHAAFFKRHGLDLFREASADLWRISVHEAIRSRPDDLPKALEEALIDVIELSNREAHELFLEAVRKGHLDLGPAPERLTAEEVALRAYLTHRELFEVTRTRLHTRKPKRFLEFFDLERTPLHQHVTPERIDAFRKEVSRWWKERRRHPYTEVHTLDSDEEFSFFIVHGDLRKSQAVVEEKTERADSIRFVPTRHDVLHFHKATGRLAVNTQYRQDIDAYRELVGRMFLGDSERYRECTLYTGAPLLREGAKALSTEGVPKLKSVTLRELSMSSKQSERKDLKVTLKDSDLAPVLEKAIRQAEDLELDRVDQLKLSMRFEGARADLSVVLEPPNKLTFDRRARVKEVLAWLKSRGFMVPPAPIG